MHHITYQTDNNPLPSLYSKVLSTRKIDFRETQVNNNKYTFVELKFTLCTGSMSNIKTHHRFIIMQTNSYSSKPST